MLFWEAVLADFSKPTRFSLTESKFHAHFLP
jgi:hypothetical protein